MPGGKFVALAPGFNFYYYTINVMYTQEEKQKKPISRFESPYEKPMAEKPLSVRVEADIDAYVRSLANRTGWLREAIVEKYERDLKEKGITGDAPIDK